MAYRVWQPIPFVIWLLAGTLGLVALVVSIVDGHPARIIAVSAVFLAAILFSAVRYFGGRLMVKRRVRSVSRSGVDIMAWDASVAERWNFGIDAVAIKAIDDALAWWIARFPEHEAKLRRAWASHYVTVQSTPIAIGGGRFAAGLLPWTDAVMAVWRPGATFDATASVLRHEFGHAALRKLDVTDGSDDADHLWMQANEYGA